MLNVLGMTRGAQITIEFTRNIPIGKGLSSSTADMLAVVRAFQEVFGVLVTETFISRLFAQIEPHDALHYPMSVAYNHRQGNLLNKLGYIPNFNIIAVDAGGELSTVEYNKHLNFSQEILGEYDQLYQNLLLAFTQKDDREIARCAKRSAELHVKRTGNRFLDNILKKTAEFDILGILATHSGTCAGLLLSGDAPEAQISQLITEAIQIGQVFHTKTLKILV